MRVADSIAPRTELAELLTGKRARIRHVTHVEEFDLHAFANTSCVQCLTDRQEQFVPCRSQGTQIRRYARDLQIPGDERLIEIAQVDDAPERARQIGADFDATSDDPAYKFVVPDDGTYRLLVRDQFGDGRKDPSFVYRLAIRSPEYPSVRFIVNPSPPLLRATV